MKTFATPTRQRSVSRVPMRGVGSRNPVANLARRAEVRQILDSPGTQGKPGTGAHKPSFEREAPRQDLAIRASAVLPVLLQLDRNPDVSHRGLHTFYVDVDRFSRVMAVQVGIQQGEQRVSLRVSTLVAGLRNPPIGQRSMVLAVAPTATLTPRIVSETEVELPQGDVFQKTIALSLSNDPNAPIVSIVVRYGRPSVSVPFPEGSFGVWRTMAVDTGWIGVNDGFREIAVNFPSEVAGSLWSSEWHPYVHPGLGYGFLNTRTRQFFPYPRGRPDIGAQQEAIRTAIHLIPVLGSLVMAGEALVGRSIWGRPLSTTERAILGVGAVLAEIGPILRVGGAAARTATAVSRLTTVTRMSRIQALRLVVGSRALTDAEVASLNRFAVEVRAGRSLSAADQVVVERLLGKLNESARAVAVRGEVAAVTGTARQPGRFTDLAPRTSADETRVGQAVARDLNADVVRIPESTATGVRTGDYLVDDFLVEAYSPRTANLNNLLRQATSKHQQAGTLVIDLTHTSLPQNTVVGSAARIFGRPEAADLNRILFVQGNRVVADAIRSASAGTSQLPGVIIRGAASGAAQQSR